MGQFWAVLADVLEDVGSCRLFPPPFVHSRPLIFSSAMSKSLQQKKILHFFAEDGGGGRYVSIYIVLREILYII